MNPTSDPRREPEKIEPITEGTPADEVDFIDKAVAEITDASINERLRRVLGQPAPDVPLPGLHDYDITAPIRGICDPARTFSELAELAARASAAQAAAVHQLSQARETVEAARREAAQIVAEAREETDIALTQSAQMLRTAREAAAQMLRDARAEADEIVGEAQAEAEQIIGDALTRARSVTSSLRRAQRSGPLDAAAVTGTGAVEVRALLLHDGTGLTFACRPVPPAASPAEASGEGWYEAIAPFHLAHLADASKLAALLIPPHDSVCRDLNPHVRPGVDGRLEGPDFSHGIAREWSQAAGASLISNQAETVQSCAIGVLAEAGAGMSALLGVLGNMSSGPASSHLADPHAHPDNRSGHHDATDGDGGNPGALRGSPDADPRRGRG